jgi:hypothetical protein
VKQVIYLAHPVSASTIAEIAENLDRAREWLAWLVKNTDFAVCASWIGSINPANEQDTRERGMEDNLAILERCDAIILVGGRVSSGMAIERDHAQRHGIAVCSLAGLGAVPPLKGGAVEAEALRLIRECIVEVEPRYMMLELGGDRG